MTWSGPGHDVADPPRPTGSRSLRTVGWVCPRGRSRRMGDPEAMCSGARSKGRCGLVQTPTRRGTGLRRANGGVDCAPKTIRGEVRHRTSPRNYPGSCSQREPKRPKGDCRKALIYEALLWRVGSRLDLERAHNPLYWGFDANPRAQQIAELPIPLGFEPKGALIGITSSPKRHRNKDVRSLTP